MEDISIALYEGRVSKMRTKDDIVLLKEKLGDAFYKDEVEIKRIDLEIEKELERFDIEVNDEFYRVFTKYYRSALRDFRNRSFKTLSAIKHIEKEMKSRDYFMG